jgi:hypothetical protein
MTSPIAGYKITKREVCEPEFKIQSLTKTRHLRDAMATTLRDYINTLQFSLPASTEPKGFAEVYRSWAKFESRALTAVGKLPAATVLPGELTYPPDYLTPRMDADSWHRDSEDGELYSIWMLKAAEAPFLVVARATSDIQRDAINLAFEDAFSETGTPGAEDFSREGKLLTMDSYFGRKARFTLLSQQNLDSEATARENRWLAQFEILGHSDIARKVKTPRFKPRVRLRVNMSDTEDC